MSLIGHIRRTLRLSSAVVTCLLLAFAGSVAVNVAPGQGAARDMDRSVPAGQASGNLHNAQRHPDAGPELGCWGVVPSPNYRSGTTEMRNRLSTVDAVDSNTAWATGYALANAKESSPPKRSDVRKPGDIPTSRPEGAAIAQLLGWDGIQWSIVYTQPLITIAGGTDVVAIDRSHAWAILDNTVLHWNGISWSVNQTFPEDGLANIDALSDHDVWVLGRTVAEPPLPFSAHWNGSSWTEFPVLLPPGTTEAALYGLAMIASNDVWAVGYYYFGPYDMLTLAIQWDGTSWRMVATPNPSVDINSLNSVSAVSPSDVWAVGWSVVTTAGSSLAEHWDGASWQIVATPDIGRETGYGGLLALASDDTWASGYVIDTDGFARGLTSHWDGASWEIVPNPSQSIGDTSFLGGISSDHSGGLWIVGDYQQGTVPERTLVLRYDENCIPTATPTAVPTSTSSPTPIPTPAPPFCPGQLFTDVCPGTYYYTPVLWLYNLRIVSGYQTSPPCDDLAHAPCFKPFTNSTRGQIAKMVVLAANLTGPVQGQTFEDMPPGSTFYTYTEQLAERGLIAGYLCGSSREPCVPPDNKPYFRPNSTATRAQLSKIVAQAFNFTQPVTGQIFADVPPQLTFYQYIQRLAARGIIQGYSCGGPNEPCDAENRPYFRPNANASRRQSSKIIYLCLGQTRMQK